MRGLAIALFAVLLVAACGGGVAPTASSRPAVEAPSVGDQSSPPPTSPSPVPTPLPTLPLTPSPAPSVAPELKTIEDLLGAKHPKTKASAAVAAIKAAVTADSVGDGEDGWDVTKLTTEQWEKSTTADGYEATRTYATFAWCRKPNPSPGDPNGNRSASCLNTIVRLFKAYRATGIEADYAAALAVYNYARATLPIDLVEGNIDQPLLHWFGS